MYVCHCRVVNDRHIAEAIACGAADVCGLAEACGVGVRCGGCLPKVREMLADRGLPTDEHLKPADIRAQLAARHLATESVSA